MKLGEPRAESRYNIWSHPAGVRGLKRRIFGSEMHAPLVAPRRGAWVETL